MAKELPTHPKFGFFLWRILAHSLPLGDRVAWGDDSMRECQVCGLERETHRHFLVGCGVALESVRALAESIRMPWLGGSSIEEWLLDDINPSCEGRDLGARAIRISILWARWKARNNVVFRNAPFFFNINVWANSLNEMVQGLVAFAKAGNKSRAKEARGMLESLRRRDIIRDLCPLLHS